MGRSARSLAAVLASSSTCPLLLGRWGTAITISGLLIAVPVIGVGDILQGLRGTLCRIVFSCGPVALARWSFGSWVQYCINVPTRLTLVNQRELISRMNSIQRVQPYCSRSERSRVVQEEFHLGDDWRLSSGEIQSIH